VDSFLRSIDESPLARHEIVTAFRSDAAGRVKKSLNGHERFKRWGQHYLRSLLRALEAQACTNPIDASLQPFAGPLFLALRDRGDELFRKLPPPHNSAKLGAGSSGGGGGGRSGAGSLQSAHQPAPVCMPPPAPSINNYTTDGGGCFGATSTVMRRSSEVTNVASAVVVISEVRAGDELLVAGGCFAKVVGVVVTPVGPREGLVSVPGGPLLTAHHPLRVQGGGWRAPLGLGPLVSARGIVFNLVLEHTHVLLVDGVECVSLGHCLEEPGAAHAFYGTRKCIEALEALPEWSGGRVVVTTARDEQGHAIGFAPAVLPS